MELNKITEDTVKEAAKTGGNRVVNELLDIFLMPKIEKWKNKPKDIEIIYDLIDEYLKKCYERDRYMNTIVFKKEKKTIDELYIPLTIVKNGRRSRDKIVINDQTGDIYEQENKILIIDTAGMGKSTLVKFLYLDCLKHNYGIPFLIELRMLEKNQTISEYITKIIGLRENNLNINDIEYLIEKGDFIFFLDGYDEIGLENKEQITNAIREFITKYDNNNFVLTSREDDSIHLFTEFEKYHIKPLEPEEAYELIRKYDGYGETSKELINEIKANDQYEILQEFLSNPLMVSLLYSSYCYKGVIQYKKHLFYRQVYDALFDGHDLLKGSVDIHKKRSGLDIEEFNGVLSAIGFFSIKQGRIQFDKNELIELINNAVDIYGCSKCVSAIDFIHDILHAVPLFVEEGGYFKWAHKSFAEYFASCFICCVVKDHEESIIKSIIKSKNNQNYYNVMDFCYDMDKKIVQRTIIYEVVSNFVKEYEKTENDENIEERYIDARKFSDFISTAVITRTGEQKKKKKVSPRENIGYIRKAFEMYRKEFGEDATYLCALSRTYGATMFISTKPYYEMTRLLFKKNVDIFKEVKIPEHSLKFVEKLEEGNYKSGDERFMNVESYKAITSYLHHRGLDLGKNILDYDKCKKMKQIIEDEIRNENSDLYLFV